MFFSHWWAKPIWLQGHLSSLTQSWLHWASCYYDMYVLAIALYYIHWLFIFSQTSELKKSHCCSSISSCMDEIHHLEYQCGIIHLTELHSSASVNTTCFLVETVCSWKLIFKFHKSTLVLHAGMDKVPSEFSSFMVYLIMFVQGMESMDIISSQVNYSSFHPHLKITHVLYERTFFILKLIYGLNSPNLTLVHMRVIPLFPWSIISAILFHRI